MATASEHVLISNPDKLVLLAEMTGMDSCDPEPTVMLRLVVELCSGYGAGLEDVDTMEDLTCRVPLRGLGRQGAAERAFGELVASLNNPMLRPDVTAATEEAAARVRARCGDPAAVDELSSTGFLLRVTFIDAWDESVSDDESGSDMEFGEFARSGMEFGEFINEWEDDYEVEDDDDDDGSGVHFSVRRYNGGFARGGGGWSESATPGFGACSDGPELTDQHELTALQSVRQPQSKLPSAMFPMRARF